MLQDAFATATWISAQPFELAAFLNHNAADGRFRCWLLRFEARRFHALCQHRPLSYLMAFGAARD